MRQSHPGSSHHCSVQRIFPATYAAIRMPLSDHCLRSALCIAMIQHHIDPSATSTFCQRLSRRWSIVDSLSTSANTACFQFARLPPIPFYGNSCSKHTQWRDQCGWPGHIGALVLFSLTAAFDTVDHSILVDGSDITWVAEFLNNQRQVVHAGKTESDDIVLQFGSACGPRVFTQYTEGIFQRHDVWHNLFVDDMQGHSPLRTTWRCSCDHLSAWELHRLHLRLVCCQVFIANADKDRTTVVWFWVAVTSAAITDQYIPHQPVPH